MVCHVFVGINVSEAFLVMYIFASLSGVAQYVTKYVLHMSLIL